MSMIRAAGYGSGGGAGGEHEELSGRPGIGPDGAAWHLDTELYNRIKNSQFYRGLFTTGDALIAAYPVDVVGAYAIVLDTGTFWFWEGLAIGWVDSGVAATDVILFLIHDTHNNFYNMCNGCIFCYLLWSI